MSGVGVGCLDAGATRTDRARFHWPVQSGDVTALDDVPSDRPELTSRGYRITVDGGRNSFFAIRIGEPDSDTAWIMSDTVRALDAMR